jgi:hypothetical protein
MAIDEPIKAVEALNASEERQRSPVTKLIAASFSLLPVLGAD